MPNSKRRFGPGEEVDALGARTAVPSAERGTRVNQPGLRRRCRAQRALHAGPHYYYGRDLGFSLHPRDQKNEQGEDLEGQAKAFEGKGAGQPQQADGVRVL